MADFCVDCWNKIYGTEKTEKEFILSKELCFCEECCQWKKVIFEVKKDYYEYIFKMVTMPFYIIWRIILLPYTLYKKIKTKL